MKINISKWLLLSAIALFAACDDSTKSPEWIWDEEEEETVDAAEKPRYIWIDAAANFPDYAVVYNKNTHQMYQYQLI